jgi:hypothetical protein
MCSVSDDLDSVARDDLADPPGRLFLSGTAFFERDLGGFGHCQEQPAAGL